MKDISLLIAKLTLGASILGTLTGCFSRIDQREIKQNYSFDNFEKYISADISGGYTEITALASADLDGDGDIDIVFATMGRLFLYENKMPQKNQLEGK